MQLLRVLDRHQELRIDLREVGRLLRREYGAERNDNCEQAGQCDAHRALRSVRSIIRRVKPLTTPQAIFYGGLTVGALDLIDAFVFFGLRSGARPMGILHSIAAGFLGRDAARAGGVSTAIVGFFSHFLVAFCIVTVYVLMSRVIPALRKQWVVCGIVFGVAAYFVMTWFVVPMSNAGNGRSRSRCR